jgi:hypothetical protein
MDETRVERDFSRVTLRHNIETILRKYRDVHPHSMLEKIMAAIPVGTYPARPTDPGEDKVEAVALTDAQIKYMARRILGWRLPENFHPDAGISFNPVFNKGTRYEGKHKPIGTNLFDADQAEAMVRYMAEGLPSAIAAMGHTPPSGEDGDLVERLRRKMQRLPAQGGGTISSDGTATSYITDDGMRLVNPDGPAAADRITALLSDVGVLREALTKIASNMPGGTHKENSEARREIARTALQGIGGEMC